MSTQPTDDDSPPPTPTAQRSEGPIPSAVLDRRTFLRGTAAAGGTALAAGTATADEDDEEEDYEVSDDADHWLTTDTAIDLDSPSAYYMAAIAPVPWAVYVGYSIFDDVTQTDSDDGDATLHLTATNAMEAQARFDVLHDNYLTDTRMVSNVEARHGITSSWEDGEDYEQGYQRALDRLRRYYEIHEQLRYEIMAFTSLQLGFVSDAGTTHEEDSTETDWAHDSTNTTYTGTAEYVAARPTSLDPDLDPKEQPEYTVQLHDGTEYSLQPSPQIRFYTDEGESYETDLAELVENWDAAAEEATVEGPDHTWTTKLRTSIPNVPDADLDAVGRVQNLADQISYLTEIEEQADQVAANYDSGLVEQIFNGLDDGTIDPAHVRGVEGQARFMAGTENGDTSAYRLALTHMLGLSQADLSKIESMTVEYSGYRGRKFVVENQERVAHLADLTEEPQTYEGKLMAAGVPDGQINSGQTYATGRRILAPVRDNTSAMLNSDGSVYREIDQPGEQISLSHDGELVAIEDSATNRPNILNFATGEEIEVLSEEFADFEWDPEGGLLIANDDFRRYTPENWNSQWSVSETSPAEIRPLADTGRIVALGNSDARILDLETGDTIETISHNDTRNVRSDSQGRFVLPDDTDGVMVYNSDGEQVYQFDSTDRGQAAIQNNLVAHEVSGDWVVHDLEEQQEIASGSFGGSINDLDIAPWGDYLVVAIDSSIEIRDIHAQGDVVDSANFADRVDGIDVWPPRSSADYAGSIERANFHDGPSAENIDMPIGRLTVESITDSDGEEVDSTEYDQPEYDSIDNTEYGQYIATTTEYLIEESDLYHSGDDGGDWWPSVSGNFDGGFGGQLAGLAVIAAIVISVVWSVVSDAIPFLGN